MTYDQGTNYIQKARQGWVGNVPVSKPYFATEGLKAKKNRRAVKGRSYLYFPFYI